MSEAANFNDVVKANDPDIVLMILGFLGAETTYRPKAIHFDLTNLLKFFEVPTEDEFEGIVRELIKWDLIASVGGFDESELLEESEFKLLPAGVLLLASNKFKTLTAFERCAPQYLETIQMFYKLVETDSLFQKKWGLSGFSVWAESQEINLNREIQETNSEFSDQKVPASDRIVSKSDNLDAWNQAVDALDNAIDAIERSDELDNEFGPEKSAMLDAIKAGRQLFEDAAIRVDVVRTLVLEPLKQFAQKYHREIVAGAIQTALMLIGTLLLL